MRNIQLVIEYDGSRYDGWQKQEGRTSITVQDKIEDVLAKMEGEAVDVIGAARTEAGVHAYRQIANFKTNSDLKIYEIKQYLNRYLPRDIAVIEALEVPERFHASFNAVSFEYEYKISIGEVPSVFERKYNYYCFKKPDVAAMKEAAKHLIGKHDFKAFSDNKRMKKSTQRELMKVQVYGDEKEIIITICGDDFWPHMVRIIVGTLIEVGLSEKKATDIPNIIQSKNRELAGATADAKGLFLVDVYYQ
jgi:tRNA pseudouridine38-40 synthase